MSVATPSVPASGTLSANSRNAFLAGFLGWTFDAFDFFILTYVLAQVAAEFHQPIRNIAFTLTASLLMRPIGALLFGLMADHYGRRVPLILDILFYSVMEIASGLAPSYRSFLILRLLYGIGMGGAWGVGASLAMESVPAKWRGVFSGILQEGYALGNLLAAIAFWTVFPKWGWRPMFFLGVVPALLTLFVLVRVEESDVWKSSAATRKGWGDYFAILAANWKRCLYIVLLMTMMNFLSHGTQDLYPTFLQQQRHFNPGMTAILSVISMAGAIVGGVLFGLYSDRGGRRRAMVTAQVAALVVIPLWLFVPQIALLAVGAFLMQFMVQGAWGVIPAHINELSPDRVRGFLPGFAYQVGVLIAATAPYIEAVMTQHLTYAQSMGALVTVVVFLGVIVAAVGPEAHHVAFGKHAG
jgi:SHS family lactate transporter-like MFS transporter